MKKFIQILTIIILLVVVAGFIVFFFNPLGLRDKMIAEAINYYFQLDQQNPDLKSGGNITPATPIKSDKVQDKNPLLSPEQERKLEAMGVNVEALPKEITPGMTACFVKKLGQKRAEEIVSGATPSALEIIKTKECLSK